MNIAFIGYGQVGAPLADPLRGVGHPVTLAANPAAPGAIKSAPSSATRFTR